MKRQNDEDEDEEDDNVLISIIIRQLSAKIPGCQWLVITIITTWKSHPSPPPPSLIITLRSLGKGEEAHFTGFCLMLLGLEPLSSHTGGNNGHTRLNYWISVPPTSGKHLSLENSTNIELGSHENL